MHKLNILIMGGTGFIGKTLSGALLDAGHSISVLSRNCPPSSCHQNNVPIIQADVSKPGIWQDRIPEYEVIINMTGASIFRRWNSLGKQELINSRILTTGNIVDAIRKRQGNIRQFYSVSGVGYYGFHGDELIDENGSAGSDFIAQVAARWEVTAQSVQELGVRLIVCRLGHVLGMHGGALPKLVTMAKLHLGSYWGSGNQWISWVHEKDLARAILFLIDTPTISGPVNITAPNPVRNREMMQILTKTIGRRAYIQPVSKMALQFMLGQFSSVFVNGQRVVPVALQQKEFSFKFPSLDLALRALLKTHH